MSIFAGMSLALILQKIVGVLFIVTGLSIFARKFKRYRAQKALSKDETTM